MTTPPVTFTQSCIPRLKLELSEYLMDYPDVGIRVGVKGGSCAGFAYQLFAETTPSSDRDFVWEQDGIPLRCDSISAQYLKGTAIDFVKQGLQEGFTFNTPNSSQCGCGKSFSPNGA